MIELITTPHSSNVNSMEYNSDTKILFVLFKGEREYRYSDVTGAQWEAIKNDSSAGHAINVVLKDNKYEAL